MKDEPKEKTWESLALYATLAIAFATGIPPLTNLGSATPNQAKRKDKKTYDMLLDKREFPIWTRPSFMITHIIHIYTKLRTNKRHSRFIQSPVTFFHTRTLWNEMIRSVVRVFNRIILDDWISLCYVWSEHEKCDKKFTIPWMRI